MRQITTGESAVWDHLRDDDGFYSDELTVYYIAEAGAGTFEIQVSSSICGPWTTVSTVNADNGGAAIGAVAKVTTALQDNIIRTVHVSGGLVDMQWVSYKQTGPGAKFLHRGEGGIDVDKWSQWDPQFMTAMLNDFNPDVIVFQCADTVGLLDTYFETLYTKMNGVFSAADKPAWLLIPRNTWVPASPFNGDEIQQEQAKWLYEFALANDELFWDSKELYGPGADAVSAGLVGASPDVHPTTPFGASEEARQQFNILNKIFQK